MTDKYYRYLTWMLIIAILNFLGLIIAITWLIVAAVNNLDIRYSCVMIAINLIIWAALIIHHTIIETEEIKELIRKEL